MIRTSIVLLSLSFAAVLPGCGDSPTGDVDAGRGIDAAVVDRDAAADTDGAIADTDAAARLDGAVATDGAADTDAASTADAGSVADAGACPRGVETMPPSGACDGRGMVACTMWAERNAPRGETASAICLRTSAGGCARASECADIGDPATCRCGMGPACAVDESCVERGRSHICVCAEPR